MYQNGGTMYPEIAYQGKCLHQPLMSIEERW